jgi:hypothetical protein
MTITTERLNAVRTRVEQAGAGLYGSDIRWVLEALDAATRALAVAIPALERAQGTIYQCGGDPGVRYACERAEEAARQAIAAQHDEDCPCAQCTPDEPPAGYGA